MKRFFLEVVMEDEIEEPDLLALTDGMPGMIDGVPVGTVILHTDDDMKDEFVIHRLQEMEYATVGGNSEGAPVPADVLSRWFCYVMGGEAQQ